MMKALRGHFKRNVRLSMKMAKLSSMMINTMGLGGLISMLTYIPLETLSRAGIAPPDMTRLVGLVVNTPTEVMLWGGWTP